MKREDDRHFVGTAADVEHGSPVPVSSCDGCPAPNPTTGRCPTSVLDAHAAIFAHVSAARAANPQGYRESMYRVLDNSSSRSFASRTDDELASTDDALDEGKPTVMFEAGAFKWYVY